MNQLTVKFDTLPVWVKQDQATKLIPQGQLKALRENKKIAHCIIKGKTSYSLSDILREMGVDLIFYAEQEQKPSGTRQEAPMSGAMKSFMAKPIPAEDWPTAVKVEDEEEVIEPTVIVEAIPEEIPMTMISTKGVAAQEGTLYYCDAFTKSHASLPAGAVPPVFKYSASNKKPSVKQNIVDCRVVDIQFYKACYNAGAVPFPKVRFTLQSSKNPKTFILLQFRYDSFFPAFLADMLAEWVFTSNDEYCTINMSETTHIDKTGIYLSVKSASTELEVSSVIGKLEKPKLDVLQAKFIRALDAIKDKGIYNRVQNAKKFDNNFLSFIIKEKEDGKESSTN